MPRPQVAGAAVSGTWQVRVTLQWLNENSSLLNAGINLGMLLVWAVYLDLLLRSYRRSRRCKIVIGAGGWAGLGARCLITNLSAEPVYVVRIRATVTTESDQWVSTVTEFDPGDGVSPSAENMTRQGPLLTGHWRDIGSVSDVLHASLDDQESGHSLEDLEGGTIELLVIALYGSEDIPVGARRSFRVRRKNDGWTVTPQTGDTMQVRTHRHRKELLEYM